MADEPRARWLTPTNVLIVFLLLAQTATMLWLEWNEIDMQRRPPQVIEACYPQPKVKP
jgi:hypothetical protein